MWFANWDVLVSESEHIGQGKPLELQDCQEVLQSIPRGIRVSKILLGYIDEGYGHFVLLPQNMRD